MKSNFGFICLLFVFLILSVDSNAKKDFRDGFIISNNNDTILGQVLYRINELNFKSCLFKKDDLVKDYLPSEIIGFGYKNDKFYTSKIVDSTFVQTLISGELSLYRHKANYYVQKKGGTIFKLENNVIHDTVNDIERIYFNTKWRGIMAVLTYDCIPNSNVLVQQVRFDELDLSKFVIKYNDCKSLKYIDFKKLRPWYTINLGLSVGLINSSLYIHRPEGQFLYFNDQYKSLDPTYGLVFDISLPRISEKLSIQSEFYYYKTAYSNLKLIDGPSPITYNTNIGFTSISIPVSAKFSFRKGKVPFYLQSGIVYDNHLKATTNLQTKILNNSGLTIMPDKIAFKINNYQFGIWAGIGIIKKIGKTDISANLRFFQMTNLSESHLITANPSRISTSIIIYLNKQ